MQTGPWTYLALVLSWSAGLWLLSARLSPGIDPASSPLFLIGGAGPLLWALVFTHARESAATQRDYWRRAFDPRRISPRWWVISLLLHPAIVALALVLDGSLEAEPLRRAAAAPSALLPLAFFTFWFGPLPEEMGWRGFALDRLQRRMNALSASLVVGVAWALWHVPLFFVPETYQYGLGFGSVRFWIFSATLLPLSVLMTWVYLHTGRSTLAAALFHFAGNMAGVITEKSESAALIELALLTICAGAAVTIGGPTHWLHRCAGDEDGAPRTAHGMR
jgi:membrane protease YdiL (CAAX protease family)